MKSQGRQSRYPSLLRRSCSSCSLFSTEPQIRGQCSSIDQSLSPKDARSILAEMALGRVSRMCRDRFASISFPEALYESALCQ